MSLIPSDHRVTEVQRGRSDQQMLKRNIHTTALLLAVDSSGEKRDLLVERIDWNVCEQFLNEGFAPGADLRCVGAVDSVGELDQCNGGKSGFLIAGNVNHLFSTTKLQCRLYVQR